ncbi:MAG: GGDEF domain-containing protein [Methylobacterium radiotolerans]
MSNDGRPRSETEAVRAALVADLAHTTLATGVMGVTLVGIATYAHAVTGMVGLAAAAVGGGMASASKIVLMRFHVRRKASGVAASVTETHRWEGAHAIATCVVATAVGVTATMLFLQPDPQLQMLATCLMFGYGSGVVGRIGIRPRIAVPALLLAAVAPIAAAAHWNDTPHLMMAAVFAVFLLASFESVRHVHRTAVGHVGTRLEMASLARIDPLTGLANRLGLREAFATLTPERPLAALCLDLDGFKPVNDRHGHAAGDNLLRMVAKRLLTIAASDATVARTGGDEFVILLPGLRTAAEAQGLARRLDASLREPFGIGGVEMRIAASVGYAVSEMPVDLDDLMARADEVSYRVKREGRADASPGRTKPVLQAVA